MKWEGSARGWDALLDDLFLAVLRHLGRADVASCRLVCGAWRAQVGYLLEDLQLQGGEAELSAVAAAFPALTTLSIEGGSSSSSSCSSSGDAATPGSLQALTQLRRLRRVVLKAPAPIPHGELPTLDCSQLLPLADAPALQAVALLGWRLHAPGALQQLAQLCCLELGDCCVEDWQGGLAALLRPLAHLQALAFSGHAPRAPRAGVEPLAGLSALTALTSISLGGGAGAGDALCAELAALPRLARLDVSRQGMLDAAGRGGLTDAGLASFAQLSAQLLRLILHGHTSLTDKGLAHIARLTQLEHLDLQLHDEHGRPTPSEVSDAGLQQLAALTSLRTLKLGSCGVAEAGCAAIAGLGALTCLELRDCASLADAALFGLAPLSGLRRLCLAGCVSISDIGVAALVRKTTRLTHLDLSGCHRNISDTTLAALAQLGHLRWLDLSHCEGVTDAGLEVLLLSSRGLEWLACRDCSITDDGCTLLAAYGRSLHHLSLEHCPKVTNRGLRRLATLPTLRELELFGTGVKAGSLRHLSATHAGHRLKVSCHKECWWMR